MPTAIAGTVPLTSDNLHKILMIDLENCPGQIQYLMCNLEQYGQIVICYAQSGSKVPLDWIIPLTSVVNNQRLKIVKMSSIGKNAADFGIAFWAGMLLAQSDKKTHFDIVSDDSDLDYVVSLLKSQNCSAQRIPNPKQSVSTGKATEKPQDPIRAYCLHLYKHQKNRPVKKETLLNHIKAQFNGSEVDAEKLFQALCNEGAIKQADNKIEYVQKKINELANPAG